MRIILHNIVDIYIMNEKLEKDSNNDINEITLEYMMNKEHYQKYIDSKHEEKEITSKKDKKFYRRRICDLTKQLLLNESIENNITIDIKHTFELYAKACINYFKLLDRSDIIQDDYSNIIEKIHTENNDNLSNVIDDTLLMRSINLHTPNSLEKIIKRSSTTIKKQEIIPQKKDINLKDPVLKNKGIRKKNNIINNYDNKDKKNHKEIKETT